MTNISPQVIYHQDGILVVDKPSGLASQPTRNGEENLFDKLRLTNSYVGLHHRLDRPASGLLLLCTDRRCNAAIASSFKNRRIIRLYQAIVLGEPPEHGTWDMPIGGQHAQSEYKRLAQHDGIALLEVKLNTGRRHQIRRHAQSAGFPIIGDRRYGGAAGGLWSRLCLHAVEIQFMHPRINQPITCRSEMPTDMERALNELG